MTCSHFYFFANQYQVLYTKEKFKLAHFVLYLPSM